MTTYGLTETGFVKKPLSVIISEVEARVRARYPTLPLDESTPEGFIIGVFAERENECWQLLEALHACRDPDKATKLALRSTCLLTGTIPPPATYSAVTMLLVGDLATAIPEGSRFRIEDTDREFLSLPASPEPELEALDVWTAATSYAVDDLITTSDERAYICIAAGLSHASVEPTDEDDDVTDGSVHWLFLGEGAASAYVECRSTEVGPVSGNAYLIEEIVTPIAGLNAATNPLDATLGSTAISDGALRVLREVELSQAGTGTAPAIRSALVRLLASIGLPESNVSVFFNNTEYTDDDGVPPHAVEALVTGGEDEDIAQALYDNVTGGITYHGTEEVVIVDDEGTDVPIHFSRVDDVPIYIIANVTYDADNYPANGDDQVQAAIVAFGNALRHGRNVFSRAVGSSAIPDEDEEVPGGVAGVLDIEILLGVAPAPASTATISITSRQRATFDTSRVTVNSTPGEA